MNPQITARRNFLKKRASPLTIGFTAIADFSSFIGQEYLAGIMKAAEQYGVNFINITSAIRPSLFVDPNFLSVYLSKTAFMHAPLLDGLITWASSLSSYMKNEEIQSLFSSLSPLPMVDIGYIDIPNVPSIRIDNDYSIHLLVEHLVKCHGFSRIAFFGSRFSLPHQLRLEAFKKEIKQFGLDLPDDWIFLADSLDEQDVAAQVKRFRNMMTATTQTVKFGTTGNGHAEFSSASQNKPQAILTSSDIIAHHIIEELEKHGICVPDDIAVTGFNNQLASLTSSSPITTIDLAYFKRGYEAVEILIDRIMEKEISKHGDHNNADGQAKAISASHTVPTSLVVRQSCGCFEREILDAQDSESKTKIEFSASSSEFEIREYLSEALSRFFPAGSEEAKTALSDALIADMYDKNVPPPRTYKTIHLFRSYLKNYRSFASHDLSVTEQISALRRIVLPIVAFSPEYSRRAENIFHSLRSLYAVQERYKMTNQQGDFYKPQNLMNLALSFSSAESTRQLENILRVKLPSLSISGIILCLSPAFSEDLNSVSIEMIHPDSQNEFSQMLPLKIREPALFPKRFFPKDAPFSLMLTVLFCGGFYLGYAYIFMNDNGNLALYDDLQELLSQNLYRIYLKEGKSKSKSVISPNREELTERVHVAPNEHPAVKGGKLNAQGIVDYLLDHIDEMCDLDKMANFFGMSKNYLTRRCKELTGYPAQTLHERLKIEHAKNLIKSGKMKMNDLSTRLGFSNPNYFSNVFKKVTGMRPTEFAEEQKKR